MNLSYYCILMKLSRCIGANDQNRGFLQTLEPRGGSRDFKGGVHNQRYTCIHHTECPSLEGDSKSGMVTQIK